jgi:hypothetical protein
MGLSPSVETRKQRTPGRRKEIARSERPRVRAPPEADGPSTAPSTQFHHKRAKRYSFAAAVAGVNGWQPRGRPPVSSGDRLSWQAQDFADREHRVWSPRPKTPHRVPARGVRRNLNFSFFFFKTQRGMKNRKNSSNNEQPQAAENHFPRQNATIRCCTPCSVKPCLTVPYAIE